MAPTMRHAKDKKFVLSAINVSGGQIREPYAGDKTAGRAAWMPDGSSLVVPMEPPCQEMSTLKPTQLWSVSFPGGEFKRLTNDLTDYGTSVDATHDGQMMTAMEQRMVSHIWVLPQGDTAKAKQITSGETPVSAVSPGPNGKLLIRSGNGKMEMMNADGTERAPFRPEFPNFISISSCGDSHVVFDNNKGMTIELWRTDADGKWVLYFSRDKLLRIAIDGGPVKELAQTPFSVR
jgi:Tol biopolymer transport system component